MFDLVNEDRLPQILKILAKNATQLIINSVLLEEVLKKPLIFQKFAKELTNLILDPKFILEQCDPLIPF